MGFRRKCEFNLWVRRSPGEGNGNVLQYSCLEKSHGQRSLVAQSPWGGKRVRHDLRDQTKTTKCKYNLKSAAIQLLFTSKLKRLICESLQRSVLTEVGEKRRLKNTMGGRKSTVESEGKAGEGMKGNELPRESFCLIPTTFLFCPSIFRSLSLPLSYISNTPFPMRVTIVCIFSGL